jgi:hypothetical protein
MAILQIDREGRLAADRDPGVLDDLIERGIAVRRQA